MREKVVKWSAEIFEMASRSNSKHNGLSLDSQHESPKNIGAHGGHRYNPSNLEQLKKKKLNSHNHIRRQTNEHMKT